MTMPLEHVRRLLARSSETKTAPRHRWQKLLHRRPVLAFGQAQLAALPGFLLVFALPIGPALIAAGWPADPQDPRQWILPGLGLGVALLGAWLARGLLRPVRKPRGLSLEHAMAPGLYEWISEAENQWGKPVVDRIVLRSGWRLRVVATPRLGLPWPATRTLEIGLPLLLTLAPEQFRALLSREIGRAANQHAILSGRLCRLTDLWAQYADHFRRHRHLIGRLLFGAQNRFYRQAAAAACWHDTLAADIGAIQFVNDRELAEALAQEAVTRRFLRHRFWPKIRDLAAREQPPRHRPYASMGKVIAGGMDRAFIQQALADAVGEPGDAATPGLGTRLEHLGFRKPLPPRPLKTFAAAEAIAPASLVGIIREFDRRWVKRQGKNG